MQLYVSCCIVTFYVLCTISTLLTANCLFSIKNWSTDCVITWSAPFNWLPTCIFVTDDAPVRRAEYLYSPDELRTKSPEAFLLSPPATMLRAGPANASNITGHTKLTELSLLSSNISSSASSNSSSSSIRSHSNYYKVTSHSCLWAGLGVDELGWFCYSSLIG